MQCVHFGARLGWPGDWEIGDTLMSRAFSVVNNDGGAGGRWKSRMKQVQARDIDRESSPSLPDFPSMCTNSMRV